jgi:hypothetical protein
MRIDIETLLAPYRLAGPDADPPDAVLATCYPDGTPVLDELPRGESLGEIGVAEAPLGVRKAAAGR